MIWTQRNNGNWEGETSLTSFLIFQRKDEWGTRRNDCWGVRIKKHNGEVIWVDNNYETIEDAKDAIEYQIAFGGKYE